MHANSTLNTTLNVKPVYLRMVHRYAYEGPCRVGRGDMLTAEYDIRQGEKDFKTYTDQMRTHMTGGLRMLEPVMMDWKDDFILHDNQWAKLAGDLQETDVFVVLSSMLNQYPAVELARRYGKPVGILGAACDVDGTACIRAHGGEAYAFMDMEHMACRLSLLRACKALRETRVLFAMKNDIISKGVQSTIYDLESFRDRVGTRFTFLNAEEWIDAMDHMTDEAREEARRLSLRIVAEAEEVHMAEETIRKSAEFFVVAREFLERYECNAFTIPCFEICATRALMKRQFTFCLAHTLFKDQGIPSACEADINVLLAMEVLMNIARKAPHMGNVFVHDKAKHQLDVLHDVPGLKMKGYDTKDLPYAVVSFTEGGWGATLRYDFGRDVGQTITLLRFHPNGRAMMAARGTIEACGGYTTVGCKLSAIVRVADIEDFYLKMENVGHHFAWVYGDCLKEVRQAGAMLGMEVVTA
ncbi:MAG: hypothetical protein JXB04_01395 [Kiritimatiellae bacterium]|nr:hypothetical protein [Kiritimatiellia bacterium]